MIVASIEASERRATTTTQLTEELKSTGLELGDDISLGGNKYCNGVGDWLCLVATGLLVE